MPTPAPPLVAASFAWTPDIPATAAYQIYARWTAGPDRASNAKYLIEHSGGTAEVAVSQRQGGGIWNLLGTYTMPSGTGNRIILTDDGANGTLVADAIRITREVDAGNIAYVHTDQLGQPQKLTDASKAVVWDRVARPFGATAAETGTTAVALRFPGQWADAESGYHYNYFRDYDPSLGRYLQSDPIGLSGGRNRYGYVRGNPANRIDPSGLTDDWTNFYCRLAPQACVAQKLVQPQLYCKKDGNCPPCEPYPTGTIGFIGPHTNHTHYPYNVHVHLYVVNQRPNDCKCFWNRNNPDAAEAPQPGWVDLNGGFPVLAP